MWPAILLSNGAIHCESSFLLFPRARLAKRQSPSGLSLRNRRARWPSSVPRAAKQSALARALPCASGPGRLRILVRPLGFAEILRFGLRAAAAARFSVVSGREHDYAPWLEARAQRDAEGQTGRNCATAAGRHLARPLPLWSPAAKCAAPANTRCASAARKVPRKRPRLCE